MINWFKEAKDWQRGVVIGITSWLVLALSCLALGGVKAFLIMMIILAIVGIILAAALILEDDEL